MIELVVVSLLLISARSQTSPVTTSSPFTPTPEPMGNHNRPFFFKDHPNQCGRMPELSVTGQHNARWDYYTEMGGELNIIYLAEARCGTCQSNAFVAGSLAERWDGFQDVPRRADQGVDIKVVAINRNHPRDSAKYRMMYRKLRPVSKWVTLLQDNAASHAWDTLADYTWENQGEYNNETIKFKSQKNDFFLVDRWGRLIRFMRNGILNRVRITGRDTQINWRDIVHTDFLLAQDGITVCDELQAEELLCRLSEDWSLNGRSFRTLRVGTSLTILIFIRADMEEYTTRGLLADAITLSQEWSSPSYVVIVDSVAQSKQSFVTVDFFKQSMNADITLLLDENNSVASKYYAAPGDVVATDELGRIIGIFNRADLSDDDTIAALQSLHVNWNPDCEAYVVHSDNTPGTASTGSTHTPPAYTSAYTWFNTLV